MPVIHDALDSQGHARVQVVLSPSAPRRLALQGAGQPVPQPSLSTGMLDTGATATIIDTQIRQALQLTPFRLRTVHLPSQPASVRVLCYKVDLMILHPSGGVASSLIVPMLTVLETPLSHMGIGVLVGCDVLSRCAYLHHGQGGTFMLSY